MCAVKWYGPMFGPGCFRGRICSESLLVCVLNFIEQRLFVQLTGTGVCLELNCAVLGYEFNWYWFVFGLHSVGVGFAGNVNWFVFGTE
jgi:hypothetical protein